MTSLSVAFFLLLDVLKEVRFERGQNNVTLILGNSNLVHVYLRLLSQAREKPGGSICPHLIKLFQYFTLEWVLDSLIHHLIKLLLVAQNKNSFKWIIAFPVVTIQPTWCCKTWNGHVFDLYVKSYLYIFNFYELLKTLF